MTGIGSLYSESLRTITARREGDAWRKVTTVEIPEVGTVARTYGVEDLPVAEGDTRTLRMVLTQTYVPVPGPPTMSCSSREPAPSWTWPTPSMTSSTL